MKKGSSMTEEQKKRISEGRKGKNLGKRNPEIGRKISSSKKGIPVPEERKVKISNTLKGRKNPEHSKVMKIKYQNGLVPWNKGKKLSKDHIEKISSKNKGRKQSKEEIEKRRKSLIKRWEGIERNKKRWSKLQRQWSRDIIERDGNKCTMCGSEKQLQAHHIISWEENESLRYDLNNGKTLCSSCHLKEHRKGMVGWNKGKKMTEEFKAKLRGPRPHVVPWNKKKNPSFDNIAVV